MDGFLLESIFLILLAGTSLFVNFIDRSCMKSNFKSEHKRVVKTKSR